MRILVIGGTGFSGPYIVRRLGQLGRDVTLLHRGRTHADLPGGIRHSYGDCQHLADFAAELKRFASELVLDMVPFGTQDAWSVVSTFGSWGMSRRCPPRRRCDERSPGSAGIHLNRPIRQCSTTRPKTHSWQR